MLGLLGRGGGGVPLTSPRLSRDSFPIGLSKVSCAKVVVRLRNSDQTVSYTLSFLAGVQDIPTKTQRTSLKFKASKGEIPSVAARCLVIQLMYLFSHIIIKVCMYNHFMIHDKENHFYSWH